MNQGEFLGRARDKGLETSVSGRMTFISSGDITVRMDGVTGKYAIRYVVKGKDMNYNACTAEQASRALKLPRR